MSKARLEIRVGIFVAVALGLAAILALAFSKGSSFLRPHYDIPLHASAVSGLKEHSQVLMSGFPVGTISAINLAPDGKEVIIQLRIYSRYQIYDDARFVIQTSGLLGDQYVAIVPTQNKGKLYPEGKPPRAEEPFNYNDLARSVTDFVPRINEAATNLNGAITDVRQYLLTEHALTNMAAAMENLRGVTERAATAMDNINSVVSTNALAISQSVSNLTAFTVRLQLFGDQLNNVVATNSPQISEAIKNIETSTEVLKSLLDDVQAGRGLLGTLIRNEKVANDIADITYNLSITTSNLNRAGLWGILWKKKVPPPPRNKHPVETPGFNR